MMIESTDLKSEYSIFKRHKEPFKGSEKDSLKEDYKGF